MGNTETGATQKNKRMTILVFHQYFSTNKGSYGTRLYEFARHWVAQGNRVIVVTSVYYKSDLKAGNLGKRIIVDGIDVIVLNVPISNKDNFIKRIYYFLLYSLQSSWYALRLNYDVVVASSGPISTGIPGLVAAIFKRKPLVFEVRDLWPGVVEEIGVIKNNFVLKLAYFFEGVVYRKSKKIIALSKGMEENIKKRFPNQAVVTVTNSANLDLFVPSGSFNQEDTFAIYTGNIGEVNNSSLLLDAAKILLEKGRGDIKIKMYGDGQLYLELLGRVKMENISNLKVCKSIPKQKLVLEIGKSFASLIPLLDLPLLDTSSPNKLYESLAAGKPIVQTTKGWIKALLDEHECGFTVSPTDANELADALIVLFDQPEINAKMAIRARELAEKCFDGKVLAEKMLKEITIDA